MKLLEVKGLKVVAGGREILHGVDLTVDRGETVALLGKNGAGKSTLGEAVMGLLERKTDEGSVEGGVATSRAAVAERMATGGAADGAVMTEGKIWFSGERIEALDIDERARRGIFMSWQTPVEIAGVSTQEMLQTAWYARGGKVAEVREELQAASKALGVDAWAAKRELNVGFSGGEKKKNELIQMMALRPKLAILDEVDSGLDMEAAKRASRVLAEFQQRTGVAYLVITHNQWILESLKVQRGYLLDSGWSEEKCL